MKDTIASIIEQRKIQKTLSLEQFNSYLKLANDDYLKRKYGFPKDQDGAETKQQITDSLLPFKETATIALVSGTGTLPADYRHLLTANVNGAVTPLDIVTELEFNERVNNAITEPTTSYPILVLRDGEVEVRPTSIASIDVVYIKEPTIPVLALTTTNGVQVNDAGSTVELEWGVEHHVDIMRGILEYIGVSIGAQDIVGYTETKEVQEN